MSRLKWRAVGGAASVLVGAGIGITTNMITDRWSWTWGSGLAALILSAVAIQAGLSLAEDRRSRQSEPPPPSRALSASMRATSARVGGDAHIYQGDNIGMTGRHVVLSLAVFGIFALCLVVWIVPGPSHGKEPTAATSSAPAGDPLRLTVTSVDNTCHRVVLPENVGVRSKPFVEVTEQPADPGKFMRDELDLGGYAHGEIIVRLNAQTSLPQQVTITDVRVVDLVAAEPVKGAFVNLQTCGGDAVNAMVIHINSPDRRPFAVDEESHETDRHFFETEIVNVAPGKKQSFVVRVTFAADRTAGSYTFRLAFDYEVDGQKASAIVDDDGRPFRLTAGCEWTTVTESWGSRNELMRQVDAKEVASVMCH
jgi:hypothetical protein